MKKLCITSGPWKIENKLRHQLSSRVPVIAKLVDMYTFDFRNLYYGIALPIFGIRGGPR